MKLALVSLGIVLSVGACKKSSGGGGGGGSSWLVGESGLMVNVLTSGEQRGYPLDSRETLNSIACRYNGEAWVAGTRGTLLYTSDAGDSWASQAVPTSADLRTLATQDWGPLFVAGDGVFLTSSDTGAHWTAVGDDTISFRAMAAAQRAQTVLALSEDGAVFAFENQALVPRTTLPGARAVAVSPDGKAAILVGDRVISRSSDGGRTWSQPTATDTRLDDVRFNDDGSAIAVGAAGAIAHISSTGDVVMQQVGTADLHTVHLAELDEGDSTVGVAAGDGGAVYLTLDGGATWRAAPSVGRTVLSGDQIGDGHR